MARSDPQVNLRMPADLKDRLEAAAADNKRSLTAEIVSALEEKYPRPLALDLEAFVAKWIDPILEVIPKDPGEEWPAEQVLDLVRRADSAARKVDPALGVWERYAGGRLEIVFGVRDRSALPPERRAFLAQNVSTTTWRLLGKGSKRLP